ncbi:hypothetical protein SAMN05421763_12114 [[Luteovulum] sphaeroides subsp. megalophilum]|nr:hypothetical protein SAMN05421763_12114 [[Luteovulum] sphaeroides subsp. megalophilum]
MQGGAFLLRQAFKNIKRVIFTGNFPGNLACQEFNLSAVGGQYQNL